MKYHRESVFKKSHHLKANSVRAQLDEQASLEQKTLF